MGTTSIPTATVRIKTGDVFKQESATGDGAVDASFNAIERALDIKSKLESYHVRSVTSGRQAMGEVIVRIREYEHSFTGRGVSTDVIEASAKAYIQALNQRQLFIETKKEDENIAHSLSDLSQAV
jgi:2-isopropylmalate synthase